MSVAAFVVSVVAVLLTAGSLWFVRGQKLAADASAQASSASAVEAKRSADAAEEAVGYERAKVERDRVIFGLRRVSKNGHLLVNDGTESAFGVQVDTGDLGTREAPAQFDEFPSGHSEEYMLLFTMGTKDTHVVVTWHHRPDLSDPVQTKSLYVEHA